MRYNLYEVRYNYREKRTMTVNLHKLEQKIGEEAEKNKDFMKKLKANPQSVIEKEGKITLPKDIVVKLHMAKPDTIYIELPPEKTKLKGQKNDLANMYQEIYNMKKKKSLNPEDVYEYLQHSIALKADADKAFRKKLLNSPTKVITELLGKDLVGEAKVEVFESSMNQLHFTVPLSQSELSEASLQKISGGGGAFTSGPSAARQSQQAPATQALDRSPKSTSAGEGFTNTMSSFVKKITDIF